MFITLSMISTFFGKLGDIDFALSCMDVKSELTETHANF